MKISKILIFTGGDPYKTSLEHRIFNTSSLSVGFLGLAATCINVVLEAPIYLTLLTFVLGLIFFYFFYLARFKKKFRVLVAPFFVLLYGGATSLWFANGGTLGPIPIGFLVVMLLAITISHKRYYIFHVILVFAILLGLFCIEFFFPELIVKYDNPEVRFYDYTSTLVIFIALIAIIIIAIKRNYDKERELVDAKNDEIRDSIQYAGKIQKAILTDPQQVLRHFSDGFILNLPKDIVSGDFYWSKEIIVDSVKGSGSIKQKKVILAAADCTGHGVPGALMSMLSIALLEEIVNNRPQIRANEILDQLRDKIIKALHQHDYPANKKPESPRSIRNNFVNSINDGLDIALAIIDIEHGKMEFAGAGNPAFRVRAGNIDTIAADRMPIGSYVIEDPFKLQEISLMHGDTVYLFSDGYVDQIGGPNGKKFMYPRFRELLVKINDKPMTEQRDSLLGTLQNWIEHPNPFNDNRYEQIDDILIIGFKC